MGYNLDNIYKDILLRLSDLLPTEEQRNNIILTDEEIKEKIKEKIEEKAKEEIKIEEILSFLDFFDENFLKKTLIYMICYYQTDTLSELEVYYKDYDEYSLNKILKHTLKQLYKKYDKDNIFNIIIYVDILLALQDKLNDDTERKRIIEDKFKEQIKEQIKRKMRGGLLRKQRIIKVIRKY